jgi:predicted nucleic acid-binding protein
VTATTNTGPLIALAKLNHLHLLPTLYGQLVVPQAVYDECVIVGQTRGYSDADVIQAFLKDIGVLPATPRTLPPRVAGDVRLGHGEIEAIALAEQHQSLLLIDEVYARAIAQQMNLQTVGSLGILVEAYQRGNLAANVLDELLITIEQRKDIWIQPGLCERIRREVLGK